MVARENTASLVGKLDLGRDELDAEKRAEVK